MKKMIIALVALTSISAFADEIWCTDKGFLNSYPPDSAYTLKIDTNSEAKYYSLVDRLFLHLKNIDNKISITVGKSGSPDSTWSPIASTEGSEEVTLRINRNSLATKIYLDGYDFPTKKSTESKEKYFTRLKDYLEKANGKPLIDAFDTKYGELLIIHCKNVKQ